MNTDIRKRICYPHLVSQRKLSIVYQEKIPTLYISLITSLLYYSGKQVIPCLYEYVKIHLGNAFAKIFSYLMG
jgi:hypothetical protein